VIGFQTTSEIRVRWFNSYEKAVPDDALGGRNKTGPSPATVIA